MKYLTFVRQFLQFRHASGNRNKRFKLRWRGRLPCLTEDTPTTGFDHHYIYHVAWAARVLAQTRPNRHIDVSSTLYFSTIVSAHTPVDFYDYRPATLTLPGLTTNRADLLSLPFEDNTVESISCMHVVEHVGLGRYGDPLEPDGDLRAMHELKRVVAPGGSLLLVVPVGRSRVRFNAHRIYEYQQVIGPLSPLSLRQWMLIPDSRNEPPMYDPAPEISSRVRYVCGCFWFVKQPEPQAEGKDRADA